jgi:hypothetical protein
VPAPPISQSTPYLPATALVLAAALAVLLLVAPSAGARSFVLKARGSDSGLGVVRAIGDFKPARDPKLGAAIRAYGQPTSRRGGGEVCRVRWAGLGVRITFQNFGGVDSCEPAGGRAQKAVVSGGRPWRTAKGLRLGDGVARLRNLHPDARRTPRGFRLVEAILPFGRPVRYAVLGARIAAGRVSAFTLFIGAAGD